MTELSVSVQAQEAGTRNWSRIISPENVPESARDARVPRAPFDYYKSMSGAGYVPPQMYDNKQ